MTWASMEHLTWLTYEDRGTEVELVYSGTYELRKMTAVFQRVVTTGIAQDAAMCTFHFLNLTAGAPDATWTTTDYTQVETAFDAFWTTVKAHYSPQIKLIELNWRADGPAFRPHGTDLSPTLRTVARSVLGTNAGQNCPPQVAISVTEVTPAKFTVEDVEGVGTQLRNRWGRFYLPPPAVAIVADGRIYAAAQSSIATATQTFYNACVGNQLVPVMYSPTTGNSWAVTEVHVDDIYDVIRSRRFDGPLSREVRTITAV